MGLVQGLGPGQLRGGARRRRGRFQGLTPQCQAHQDGGQGYRGPQSLKELGPPGIEGQKRQRFPGGAAGREGRQALPVPNLVGQSLVGDEPQDPGAGVGQQVVLEGGAGGEKLRGGHLRAPGGIGRFRFWPWPGRLRGGKKVKR